MTQFNINLKRNYHYGKY